MEDESSETLGEVEQKSKPKNPDCDESDSEQGQSGLSSDEDQLHHLRKRLREVFLKPQKWRENQLEVAKENYIHEEMKKYHISPEIKIIEDDILQGETFMIEYSIYSMTIAALMTGSVTPVM